MAEAEDLRHYAPATERNRDPIVSVLERTLPPAGTVLEIASGTGQHGVYFAPKLAPRHWVPSDPNPTARQSIHAWIAALPLDRLHPPLNIDVTSPDWAQTVSAWQAEADTPPITAIVNINMIHISPWLACEGLIAGAATLLPAAGVLYLYGPFKREGRHTAPSNAAFDQSLRSQNSAWGVRDLEAVVAIAQQHQLQLSQTVTMPANNLSVIFTRKTTAS